MVRGLVASVLIKVLFLVAAPGFAAEPARYAKPELLVNQDAVERLWLEGANVQLIDVRPGARHASDKLGAARWVDAAAWKPAFKDPPHSERQLDYWRTAIGDAGVRPETVAVVYDSTFSPNATRVWWILKYWGVQDVRVLNGGHRAWDLTRTRVAPNVVADSVPFPLKPHAQRLATRGDVLQTIAADSRRVACLIDTRSDAEVAAGAIPTASHSDWTRYVDPKTGRFRSADELRALLDEAFGDGAGFDPERPAITYCRTGGRASVVAFVMELMGGEQVANYYGSWNDWSRRQE